MIQFMDQFFFFNRIHLVRNIFQNFPHHRFVPIHRLNNRKRRTISNSLFHRPLARNKSTCDRICCVSRGSVKQGRNRWKDQTQSLVSEKAWERKRERERESTWFAFACRASFRAQLNDPWNFTKLHVCRGEHGIRRVEHRCLFPTANVKVQRLADRELYFHRACDLMVASGPRRHVTRRDAATLHPTRKPPPPLKFMLQVACYFRYNLIVSLVINFDTV